MLDFKRRTNESDEELIYRVCSTKTLDETWQVVADGLNKEMNTEYTESKFRKQFSAFQKMFNAVGNQFIDNTHLDEIEKKQDELYKQQVKTADKMREMRSMLRDEARVENIVDAVRDEISNIRPITFNHIQKCATSQTEAINAIGDWHVGAMIDNYWGKYNKEIATERVNKMLYDVIDYVELFDISKLHVINLGDMIENGAIHISTRVMQEEDVIKQIMFCSELLSNYLTKLSEVVDVNYYFTLDNHSRANAKFSDSIAKESFVYLIEWFLKERLKDNSRIHFIDNTIDDTIGYTKICGKNIMFTHGNFGKMNSSIQDLALGTGIIPDYVLMGHFHEPKMKSFHGKKLVVNGCLSGVSQYALDNRLFGEPSQSMIVFDKGNPISIELKF